MRNIIKADLYRIFRGKGVYIVFVIFLGLIVLQTATGGVMNVGISYEDRAFLDSIEGLSEEEADAAIKAYTQELSQKPTGSQAPFKLMDGADSLVYILLPFLVFITTSDFTSGAAKNIPISGISRGKYIASKLTLSGITCVVMLVVYVVLSVVIATLISGFGGTFDGEFVWSVAKVLLVQVWLFLAVTCVGKFFAFLTRSGAVVGLYIAFMLGVQMLIFVLTFANDWFENLFDYDLSMLIGKAAHLDTLSNGEIGQIIAIGAVYIVLSIAGSFAIFRKAEVK
ncbi:MAG: hypothetical protein FWG45_02475 [Oscillospiraceae bacterium]|nr:hypothetical protein [Oscillospiraceae bacterium]